MRKIFFLCALCASVAVMAQTPAIGDKFAIDESGTGGHIINYEVTSVGPNEVKVAASGHTITPDVKLVIPSEITYAEQAWAVTALANGAFMDKAALSEVVLPNSITAIPASAFSGSSLTKITIPSSVTYIAGGAFASCESLTEIDFEDVSTLLGYDWNAFTGSKIITDQTNDGWLTIGNMVVHYRGAYPETLVVPEGIVNAGYALFYPYGQSSSYANVKKIVLPSTLKQINPYAFAEGVDQKMPNLETIVVKAAEVPQIGGGGSYDLNLFSDQSITLVVPCGKQATYAASDMWDSYQFENNAYVIDEDLVWDVTLQQTAGGTIAYATTVNCGEITLTATPDGGKQFTKWSDDNTENPRTLTLTGELTISAVFSTATALDETASNASAVKRIVNGQLLIERDGRIYNALGVEVK